LLPNLRRPKGRLYPSDLSEWSQDKLVHFAAKTKMPQRPLPSPDSRWPDRLRLLCFFDRSTAAPSLEPESFSYLRKRLDIIFRNLQSWQGEKQLPVASCQKMQIPRLAVALRRLARDDLRKRDSAGNKELRPKLLLPV
jgi:hypothetical protein